MSLPIPSPYFPEPLTVPGNVSDTGYRAVVRYTRTVALVNLASQAAIAASVWFWMRPSSVEMLVNLGPERFWMAALGGLVLLALSRNAPLLVQVAAFLLFALGIGGTGALWAPAIADDFPDFAKALGWTFASGWVGLLLYNLIAIRDYSFLGAYVLIWLSTAISLIVYTWLSDIVLSLAFASFIVFSGFLFYYMYDLSMILRRRRPSQVLAGALDLYRDALNFVGFPVRMMRMPRGVRRARQ